MRGPNTPDASTRTLTAKCYQVPLSTLHTSMGKLQARAQGDKPVRLLTAPLGK